MKQSKLKHRGTNIIGITGGVGAGKSQVLNYLGENYNSRIIFSDDVANDIKKKGNTAFDDLVGLLSENILGDDGEIDRKLMAAAIFYDEDMLDKVNKILHPAVNTYIINIIEEERRKGELDFVFVEAALLIENGYKEIADELWYVYADEQTRRQRLKSSRNYSDQKITEIMGNQLDDKTFRENCDFIIDNSKSLEETYRQIDLKLGDWRK